MSRSRVTQRAHALRRAALLLRIVILAMRRELLVVDVDGESMLPALKPGDRLLCSRAFELSRRAIVICRVRTGGRTTHVVKRVVALEGDEVLGIRVPSGYCWLQGDNLAASADSRHFGPATDQDVIARGVAVVTAGAILEVDDHGAST